MNKQKREQFKQFQNMTKELKTPDWLKVLNKEQFKQCLIYDLKVLQFPFRGTETAEKIKKIIEFVEEWE